MPFLRGTRYPNMRGRGFLPIDLPNLQLWTRFNQGITVTGAGVSQWDDQSGNGNHLKQGTDTNRPSKETDGSILFDGVDNFLIADAFTLVQPETIYILGKQITWTAGLRIFDGNTFNSGNVFQNNLTPQVSLHAGATLGTYSWPLGIYDVLIAVINNTASVIQVDNGTPTVGAGGTNDMGGFTLGAGGSGANTWSNIQVKEVAVFSEAHDELTRKQMIGYLARLGGLSI